MAAHSSAEWRLAIAQTHCSRCGLKLNFLEGPHCDLCVAGSEVCPPGRDKYHPIRELEKREMLRDDEESEGAPPATERSYPAFAIDLVTGEIIR